MRSLYLTIGIFCQLLIASFLVYSNLIFGANGSPVVPAKQVPADVSPVAAAGPAKIAAPVVVIAEPMAKQIPELSALEPRTGSVPAKISKEPNSSPKVTVVAEVVPTPKRATPMEEKMQQQEPKLEAKKSPISSEGPSIAKPSVVAETSVVQVEKISKPVQSVTLEAKSAIQADVAMAPKKQEPLAKTIETPVVAAAAPAVVEPKSAKVAVMKQEPEVVVKLIETVEKVIEAKAAPVELPVMGGLGPLHLLASTLCSANPDRLVADETLNHLYSRRAAVRKSLYDFMSLKFTHLEKLSSRLNAGLEVTPPLKAVPSGKPAEPAASGSPLAPSHGWPKVDKCTAHDLRLMAEAAWCEANAPVAPGVDQQVRSSSPAVASSGAVVPLVATGSSVSVAKQVPVSASDQSESSPARITSNRHQSRSLVSHDELPPSAIVAKLLHVADSKDLLMGGLLSSIEPSTSAAAAAASVAPVAKIDDLHQLNFTQQQLATLAAQAGSTRESRRNALKMTKALFLHLSEDQAEPSLSWAPLYNMMLEDELGRKRMIDIVSALSSFRGESVSSVRRDNLEFAFAMDDLRPKVLESELNVPLTFDRQFIEVEQFLQQSVKLMLANIDPERAKLTTIRYRSLMYGNPPQMDSADDQCIDLHQRLMAKNYPTDCNPTQFGQLPDVLRMAASSLELWSIETELSRYSRQQLSGQPSRASREDVGACIANLVTA